MADVAILADGVVHDIRNPLNVIRSNIYLLRQRLPEAEPKIYRSLDRMDDQITVALRLLEGLQALYRSDNPQIQRVNLNELAQRVADNVTLPEGCSVTVSKAEVLPSASADPELLEAVVRGLIRNASDALMEAHGAEDRTIRLETASDGEHATLSVTDAGPGVNPDALEHVFQPFFSTRGGRAGLGLAVAAKVARVLNGSVRLSTTPGSGTRVELAVPLAPAARE